MAESLRYGVSQSDRNSVRVMPGQTEDRMKDTERQSIVKKFEALTRANPDQLFLVDENRDWSRREICGGINVVVDQIKERVAPGMRVGILISNSAFYTIAFLALLKLEATVIPLSPRWTSDARKRCMEHTKTEFILLDSQNKKEARHLNADYFLMNQCDGIWSEEVAAEQEQTTRSLDEPAVMITTSGSTAEPKAAVVTMRQMLARITQEQQEFGLSEEDTILVSTPLYHALATRMILTSAYTGNRMVVMRGFTPEKWVHAVAWDDVTYAISVPAQLAQISAFLQEHEERKEELVSLKMLISTTSYLPPAVRDSTKRILPEHCRFYNLFASSETEFIAMTDLRSAGVTDDTVGVPVGSCEVRIEKDGESVLQGEIGEIICRGPAVFDGYCISGSKTASVGEDGFFRTGDLGYFDGNGVLHYAGRKKDIIISGGMNIFPRDIEIEIQKLEGVTGCVAYPIPDDILGEVVGIVIVADGRVNLQSVKKRCLESLSDYQQPRDIRFVHDIPRNDIGKVARRTMYRELGTAC